MVGAKRTGRRARHSGLCLGVALLAGLPGAAVARQNIVVGELSVRYDHQERSYDQGPVTQVEGQDPDQPVVVVIEDRRGDRQRYIVAPRLTFSSTGQADFLEFTWAPGLNYDHLYESTYVDQDARLRMGRDLSRQWSVEMSDSFFFGDDPLLGNELRTALIIPATGEQVDPQATAEDGTASDDNLTEIYGRRRYWRNTLDLSTDYDYGPDRTVRGRYTYGVLRNDNNTGSGSYTDYDKHTGALSIEHRFDRRWSGEGEVRFTRGLFDDSTLVVVQPSADTADATDSQTSTLGGSDDLREYYLRVHGGYDYSPRLHLFTEYWLQRTDYDVDLRRDYQVNNIAAGLEWDFLSRFHLSLSGGPSWGSFENSPTETDYNFNGSLRYDLQHGVLTLSGEKGYDQQNFDGRRSGLTDFWDVGLSLDYRFSQSLSLNLSGSYRDNRRLQLPAVNTTVVVDPEALADQAADDPSFDRIEYTERDTNAGFSLSYMFWRWYTLSGGYRYFNHDTDNQALGGGSYDEHRFFIQLSASRELLRW